MDSVIGGVLARVRADPDGAWPSAPVRDLIEEFESDAFESGILSVEVNGRGIVSWAPTSGGDHGRALAEQSRQWARESAEDVGAPPADGGPRRGVARRDDQTQEFVDRDP